MRLIEDTDRAITVQLSESNLRALLADFEREGSTDLTKFDQGVTLKVEVRRDELHYTHAELAERGPNWKGAVNA
jgi:hypothetical protein